MIDPKTKQVVTSIQLQGQNPGASKTRGLPPMVCSSERHQIFISHQGNYAMGGEGGGVEVVDTQNLLTERLQITAAELGGGAGALAVGEETGYVVNLASFPSTIHSFDLGNMELGGIFFTANGFPNEIVLDRMGRLVVPDGNAVVVLDEAGNQLFRSPEGPTPVFSIACN